MRKIVEILFYIFPVTFILGNLVVSAHLLLFIILSLFLIKKDKLALRFKITSWIAIIFFLYFFLITAIQYQNIILLKPLLYQSPGLFHKYEGTSLEDNPIFKAFLLFRFPILILIVDTLFLNKIINLKKLFLFTLCFTTFVSLDIILQYITGTDLFGFKSVGNRNSGPFGEETIAGGYLQRFSFFSFFSLLIIFENKKYKNPLLILVIIVHAVAMLLAGNRMSTLLFLFGCGLTFLFIKNLRIAMILGMIGFVGVSFVIAQNDAHIKKSYRSFYDNVRFNFIEREEISKKVIEQQQEELEQSEKTRSKKKLSLLRGSGHYYIFSNAVLVWKDQPLFGFGLKSFRVKCWHNLTDGTYNIMKSSKKYLACSNHPHNYYLELLAESGVIGGGLLLILFIIFWKDFFYYFMRYGRRTNFEMFFLAPLVITIFLEIWPLRSSGSFFSTWNATFIWLIISLLLANKGKEKIN